MSAMRYPKAIAGATRDFWRPAVLAEARGEDIARQAITEEPDDDWADHEIGRLYRLTRAGYTLFDIAAAMDISPQCIVAKRRQMKEVFCPEAEPKPAPKSHVIGRPRLLNAKQTTRLIRPREGGATWVEISGVVGLTPAGCRWVYNHRGGDDE